MASVPSISSKYFVIGLVDSSETEARVARRIIINVDILKACKLCVGDAVALVRADEANNPRKPFAVGVIWPSLDIATNCVLASSSLLLTANTQEGSTVQLYSLSSQTPPGIPSIRQVREAGMVRLQDVSQDLYITSSTKAIKGKRRDWLVLLLKETLVDLKYITNTQTFRVTYEGRIRRFNVDAVSSHQRKQGTAEDLADNLQMLGVETSAQLWTVGWDTLITVEDDSVPNSGSCRKTEPGTTISSPNSAAYSAIGGLDKEITQIRDLIEIPLTRPDLFRHFGLKPPRGILLHGPPGTGKTHLARAIASSTKSSIIVVNGPELSSAYHGETESKIRDVFSDARAKSPCIVVLDEVDALCPKREDGPGSEVEKRVVATLLTIMDGMEDNTVPDQGRVVVVATTNRPNAIDPALRRPGRFDREIEIGIPDAEARFLILQVLLARTPHKLSQNDLRAVASSAHGYVGADLSAVVREAGTTAIKRWLNSPSASITPSQPELLLSDLLTSLPSVRPSALRSVFLESAPVHYSDIGGQTYVIEKLKETVEWPLKHPEAFRRLGANAPKGVLLYGPPGCSKTLLVRACATESAINFVAVKGPELLNKYVGESERAVRETFRKARAASPCIVFFDEIDALAISRSANSSSDGGSHQGVLTSLLNEMDGVQELIGVTVVAATNRPEVLDSALMRPGRLDRLLYVGPPNAQGREEILTIRTAKMAVEPGLDIKHLAKLTEGCSGAEIVALCQEAALLTMKENMDAVHVSHNAFLTAAQAIKKQITPEVIASFERWRDGSALC